MIVGETAHGFDPQPPKPILAGHGRAERLGGGDQTLEGFFTSRMVFLVLARRIRYHQLIDNVCVSTR